MIECCTWDRNAALLSEINDLPIERQVPESLRLLSRMLENAAFDIAVMAPPEQVADLIRLAAKLDQKAQALSGR